MVPQLIGKTSLDPVVGWFGEGLEFRLQAARVNAELQTKMTHHP
jgi:hypothetical protein